MKTVAECPTSDEARLVQSLLASFDITAYLPDERTVAYPSTVFGVRVQVADEDADSARKILAAKSA
jgi:hypothetical protein